MSRGAESVKHGALGFTAVDLASAEDAFPSLPNQASPPVERAVVLKTK